ncbi:sensor histidine kinase [Falsiroseomonas oryzae]|uniref:sensor histidine kinase n=1 Tax=Falsiroseomonas oryzae TaxID=2766473 RepID=UPI0022EB1362|nr:sensor histidine kinase [Roseomonas sp. MO-31]
MPHRLRPRLPDTVRGRLLLLLLLASLPLLALMAFSLAAHLREAREEAKSAVASERDRLVAVNLAAIESADAILAALAATIPHHGAGCEALLASVRARDLMPVVVDARGMPRCGTAEASLAAEEFGGHVLRAGRGAAILLAHPLADRSGFVAAEVQLRADGTGGSAWLLDPTGHARPLGAVAAPAAPPDTAAAWTEDAGGATWIAATGLLAPGLRLMVARPSAPLRDAAVATVLRHLLEIGATLALGAIAVVLGTGHAVTRPLARLRAAVARWRGGETLAMQDDPDMPEELRDLAAAFRRGAEELAARDAALGAAVARAELLAEEVHHRVKNNLQIVSSLLALQAGRVGDPTARGEFEATRDRVAALATLHRHMYVHHDPEAIDLNAFFEELGAQLFAAVGERPGRRIALAIEASPLRIASDQAVPLALLITEAISSALKQGFPDARRGRITIRLTAGDRRARISVEDDGTWPRAEDRLRASLMRGFARQLGSELRVEVGRIEVDLLLRPPVPRERPRGRGR